MVIAYDGWNDGAGRYKTIDHPGIGQRRFRMDKHFETDERLKQSYSLGGSFTLFMDAAIPATVRFVKGFSPFFTISKIFEHATYSAEDNFLQLYAKPPKTFLPFLDTRADLLRNNIERSILWSRQHGIKYAAFLQPMFGVDNRTYVGWEKKYFAQYQERASHFRRFYDRARRHYAGLDSKYGGPGSTTCISDISGTALKDVKDRVYMDHGHLLGIRNQAIAEAIVGALDRCGLLPWKTASKPP